MVIEHSIWLSLMRERIELLRNLLCEEGFFCAHIDDTEGYYLKVLLDEIFGRENYLTTFYIRVRYPKKTLKQDMDFHKEVEMIHIYRKKFGARPILSVKESGDEKYCYYVKEVGYGLDIELGGKNVKIFSKEQYKIIKSDASNEGLKEIWATGTILDGNSSWQIFS